VFQQRLCSDAIAAPAGTEKFNGVCFQDEWILSLNAFLASPG